PLTLMTFAIFARPEMVSTTGWAQWGQALIVIAGTCGVAFAMFGRFTANMPLDIGARLLLALLSLAALLHPDNTLAAAAAIVAAAAILFGITRHRVIAPPAPGTTYAEAQE